MVRFHHVAPLALLAAACLTAPGASAAERAHKAHVHGIGKLNVAVERNIVELELEAPAMDIVGFEHAPENADDRKAAAAAQKKLRDGGHLFVFPAAAKCELDHVNVGNAALDQGQEKGHDPKAGHEEEHGPGRDRENAHKQEHAAGDERRHSEYRAAYRFACAAPQNIEYLETRYFDLFSGAKELEVQAIGTSGQHSVVMTPGNARIDLK